MNGVLFKTAEYDCNIYDMVIDLAASPHRWWLLWKERSHSFIIREENGLHRLFREQYRVTPDTIGMLELIQSSYVIASRSETIYMDFKHRVSEVFTSGDVSLSFFCNMPNLVLDDWRWYKIFIVKFQISTCDAEDDSFISYFNKYQH